MAIIKLRSPRYEVLLTPATAVSAKLELTIGGTLMQLFGGKSKGPKRSVNIRGHRGGSGYGYL